MAQEQGCPLWVQFVDPRSGLPYFLNVQTQETLWTDPDPEGTHKTVFEGTLLEDSEELAQARCKRPSEAAPTTLPGQLRADDKRCEDHRGALPWRLPISAVMGRPARKQAERENFAKTAYIEGRTDYNIWYGKWSSDRFDPRADREPASTRCDPYEDAGRTEADVPGAERSYFCLWFAKGCCNQGPLCRYYHRVPTEEDLIREEEMKDIFGRERHGAHRDDMGGVGTFTKECRSLFVGDLRFNRSLQSNEAVRRIEDQLWSNFSLWGEVEKIHIVTNKALAFVRYAWRGAAEYAKVAMADQPMCNASDMLSVRWAFEDPRPGDVKRQRTEARRQGDAAVDKKIAGWSDMEKASLQLLMPPDQKFTMEYPNTSAQYKDALKERPNAVAMGPGSGLRSSLPKEPLAGPSLPSGFLSLAEQAEKNAQEEQQARAKEVVAGIDRMAAILGKIDAMQSGGAIE